MSSGVSDRIRMQVPLYFLEDYQLFITFIEKYYEWLYREDGLSIEELASIKENIDKWVKTDFDLYKTTKDPKYLILDKNDGFINLIQDFNRNTNAGAVIENHVERTHLEREYLPFVTSDGYTMMINDGRWFDVARNDEEYFQLWMEQFGFQVQERRQVRALQQLFTSDKDGFFTSNKKAFIIGGDGGTEYIQVDNLRLIKLLKRINEMKGTKASMELFFRLFFRESIDVIYPKDSLIYIDGSAPHIDTLQVLRDDDKYSEYSIVIKLNEDVDHYADFINNIFNVFVAPSGFNIIFEKREG